MFILIAGLVLSTSLCTHAVKSGDIPFGVNVQVGEDNALL